MHALRTFFLRRRSLAIFLVAAALCMKLVVPAGYMIGTDAKLLTVQVCHDAGGQVGVAQILVPTKSGSGHDQGKRARDACPYAALSMVSTGAADAVLLAVALLFILALSRMPTPGPSLLSGDHIRPPLRGPPALLKI
jgi:hypothetical protein